MEIQRNCKCGKQHIFHAEVIVKEGAILELPRLLARYGDHPEALREAGIAYAIDQISDLIAAGVDGIHLYTMNNPQVAKQISDSVASIRRV